MFHCDNMCVVQLNNGTCRNKDIMHLVRKLLQLSATYQFECRAVYINTKVNLIADSLSRLRQVAPTADSSMTPTVLLGGGWMTCKLRCGIV